jgi:hypothetical protein
MVERKSVAPTYSVRNASGQNSLNVHDIREMRKAADTLASTANWHRAVLIDQLGLKRYIFNVLGQAAHHSSAGCLLLWPDAVERVDDTGANLGEYLYARAQKEQRLPQAILTDGEKFYL